MSVKDVTGMSTLIINTEENKPYKFVKMNLSTNLLVMTGNYALAAISDKKITEIEYWRLAIENLRGNNIQ